MPADNDALEIPGVAWNAAPATCVRINDEWWPIVVGLLEYALSDWFWDETTGDVDWAQTQLLDLIDEVGGCDDVAQIALLKETKLTGEYGGQVVAGTSTRRVFNSVEGDTSIVSLDSGKFVPIAGRYLIEVAAPALLVARHRLTLYRNGVTFFNTGQNAYNYHAAGGQDQTNAILWEFFETDGVYEWEIKHYCEDSYGVADLGVNLNLNPHEVYAMAKLTRLGD